LELSLSCDNHHIMSLGKSSATTTGSSIHTPLQDVFPWADDENQTVLVCDSVESDGRFVLCTLASQALWQFQNNKSDCGCILWLGCTPMTDQLTLNALKKIGCNKQATNGAHLPESCSTTNQELNESKGKQEESSLPLLTIRSIPTLLENVLSGSDENDSEVEEALVKDIYKQVKKWLESAHQRQSSEKSQRWVILDDVSTLSALIGESLTYALILSLYALSKSPQESCGLAIRCSGDCDTEAAGLATPRSSDWFGAGGGPSRSLDREQLYPPWERSLVELADTVVDVVPLASGYTREAHGRLIFTSRTESTVAIQTQTSVFNYCLTDNQALAIRIASGSR